MFRGNGSKAALIVTALALLFASSARAQTDDELFRRAFGAEREASRAEIPMPLVFNGRRLGTVVATFSASGAETTVRGQELIERLRALLRPERLRELEQAAEDGPMLSLSQLSELGLELELDAARLELVLTLPASARAQEAIPLRQLAPPEGGVRLDPERYSAFLNLRLAADRQVRSGLDDLARPDTLRLDLEPAVNLGPVVLEGQASFTDAERSTWRRGDVRLVRDVPERQMRWLAGDVSYPVRGFQAFRPMLGLSVARDFSLDPYRVVQPLGEAEFLLTGPSRVDVLVNGRLERTLRLGAGRYRVHDFFLDNGLNELLLRITDAAGREQIIDRSLPFDYNLLAPGVSSFGAALGFESEAGASGPRYDFDRPLASLLLRRGMSSWWTLGGGLQADRDGGVATGEALLALGWGTLSTELALSTASSVGTGGALRLGYERKLSGEDHPERRRWSAEATLRSPEFVSFGATQGALQSVTRAPSKRDRVELTLRLTQRLGARTTIGAALSARRPAPLTENGTRHDPNLQGGASLSVRRDVGRASFLSLDASWSERLGEDDRRLAVSWSWTLPHRHQQLYTSWDSTSNIARTGWRYSPAEPVGAWSASALAQAGGGGNAQDSATSLEAQWNGFRGEARLFADNSHTDGASSSSVGVQISTALVAAGGRVAFGRPVNGAFALLAPHPTLRGLDIGADRTGRRFAARALPLGGVVPDLVPYLARNLTVEVTDLPPGYDQGPGLFRLEPRYKSGIVVPVGSGATLALAGTLEDPSGQPIQLIGGVAIQAMEPGATRTKDRVVPGAASSNIFFTNRAGRFRVEGLRPGHLELRLSDGRSLELDLADDAEGVVDLGSLVVPEAAPEDRP